MVITLITVLKNGITLITLGTIDCHLDNVLDKWDHLGITLIPFGTSDCHLDDILDKWDHLDTNLNKWRSLRCKSRSAIITLMTDRKVESFNANLNTICHFEWDVYSMCLIVRRMN